MSVTAKPLRCLIIEDSEDDALLLLRQLRTGGYDVTWERVETPEAMRAALDRHSWDLVLSDHKMPRFSGLAALEILRASSLDLPFIIVSGTIGEDLAVAMIKAGAQDYLMKGRLARLVPAVERELREAAVRGEHKRVDAEFRKFFDLMPDLVCIASAKGNFLKINPAWQTTLGFSEPEILGTPFLELIHPDDRAATMQEVARQLAGEATMRFINRYRCKDGSYRWLEWRATPAVDKTLLFASARDITEHRHGQEALRASEEHYRSITQSAPDAIITADAAGRICDWNPGAERIFGFGRNEVRDEPLAMIIPSRYREQHLNGMRRLLAGGEAHVIGKSVALAGLHRDGHEFPLELSLSRWKTTEGTFFTAIIRDITERKQAEAELSKLSLAVNASDEVMFMTDLEGVIRFVNPAFTRLYGYVAAEVVGKVTPRILKSDTISRETYESFWKAILSKHVVTGELINKTQDGRLLNIESSANPILDKHGETIGFLAIQRDVTARKEAEVASRASERKFQSVFEQAAVGVIIVAGSAARFVNVNRRFCEMLGYTAAELLPLASSRDLLHPDDVAADLDQVEQINSGAIREFTQEKRFRKKDGSFMWARVYVAPLDKSEAKPTMRISVIADITARKQAEAALGASEERYRLLFENNPLSMWLYDLETLRFLAVNESAVQNYGYTREEFLGMTIKQIRPPEDIATLLKSFEEDPARATRMGEFRHRRKDGSILHVDVISRQLVFNGRPARLVLANDITEKKSLEEKLLHAQRLESIGMLAAGIAHDLNNVLAPIVFAAPMLRGSLTTARDLKILDTLEQSVGRGSGLVKQILGFAHNTTGELRPTQVKHLARDIINVIEETFPKSIQVEHHIPSALWPVQGNAMQIHQVLMNLCVNARDAMPSGGTLRLTAANRRLDAVEAGTIAGARPGAWLMLEVADTGTGIAPELLERIWTPFFTTKDIGKGTGLGLATVRGIVRSHRGFVDLETTVGRGSTFRVFLPASESESTGPGSAAPFAIPDGHGELILVVDDEAPIREIVTEILGEHGYRVVSCTDGSEALALFSARASEIALVVTDVDMPHLGGVALASAVLQIRPNIRLIAISGLSRNDTGGTDVPEIRKLVHAFLPKPFKPEELLGAIHRLLHPPP